MMKSEKENKEAEAGGLPQPVYLQSQPAPAANYQLGMMGTNFQALNSQLEVAQRAAAREEATKKEAAREKIAQEAAKTEAKEKTREKQFAEERVKAEERRIIFEEIAIERAEQSEKADEAARIKEAEWKAAQVFPRVLDIKYHCAHTGYHQKPSVIDVNQEEETIKINEAPFFLGNHIVVKFSSEGIKTILNEGTVIDEEKRFRYSMDQIKGGKLITNDNLSLEVDTYSGTVVVKYKSLAACADPYSYNEKIGYYEPEKGNGHNFFNTGIRNYKPADDFGYIMESPRVVSLFIKGLASVENLQKGLMKFRTSSFDVNGYVVQLFPEAILKITQFVDEIKGGLLESDAPLKEVSEEKDDNFELVYNSSVEVSGDLLGNNNVADLGE